MKRMAGGIVLICFYLVVLPGRAQFFLVETGGTFSSNNIARNPGSFPFAIDSILGYEQIHNIPHLTDGVYGNSNSWIGQSSPNFFGVNFNGTFTVGSFAFGRDNSGAFHDRYSGTYTVEFTTVPNPGAATPDEDWTTIGVLDYETAAPSIPWLRHRYDLTTPVSATGLRIVIPYGQDNIMQGQAIDEFEVYPPTAPTIITPPRSQTVLAGSNVTLTVQAIGGGSFQWQFNGADIVEATNTSLTLTNVQPAQEGTYTVAVTNSLGSTTSAPALLKVRYIFPLGNGLRLTNSLYTYGTAVSISFQSYFTNGMIYYTLDGTTPDFNGRSYTGPFSLPNSATIRAIAYSANFFPSGESDPVTISILPRYSLISTTAGGGTITIQGASPFLSNTVVNVTANPFSGWTFLQWLGDASGTNPTPSVTMTRNKTVRAVFGTALFTTAPGNGSVSIFPAASFYPYGTTVHLTAIPQPGSYFGIWGNAASGNTNPLDYVVTTANRTISSLFSTLSAGQYSLTLLLNGLGRVAVSPRSNSYTSGQGITVTATPDAGQTFLGWSGDASGLVNPLSLTMNQSRYVTANFSKNPRLAIQSSPGAIASEGFQVVLTGAFGEVYSLQSSSNLLDWSLIATLTNSYGTVQFTDPFHTNSNRQFHRTKQP